MENSEGRGRINRKEGRGCRRSSISFKISLSLLLVLIPFLIILITMACVMAAGAISALNDKILEVQTDYAVSSVDDFSAARLQQPACFGIMMICRHILHLSPGRRISVLITNWTMC